MKTKNEKINVPQLRFPEFSDEWKFYKLSSKCKHISYGLTVRPKYVEKGIPLISAREIITGVVNLKKAPKISLADFNLLSNKAKPIDGDIFLSKTGTIGFSALNDKGIKIAISQNIACIRLDFPDHDSADYLLQYFKTSPFQKKIMSMVNQSTIMDLQLGDIRNLIVPFVNSGEQTKIANFLKSVDKRINLLEQKKTELEQYKKGIMQQVFNGKIKKENGETIFTPPTIRFKDDDGNFFPDWEEKKLGEVFDFMRGLGLSKNEIFENGNNKCIHYGELFTTYSEIIKKVQSKTNTIGRKSKIGDILMPSSDVTPKGLATASALFIDNVVIGGDINILRPQSEVDSSFFSYLLNYSKNDVIKLVTGTTIKHIYNKDVKTLKFSIPEVKKEQEKIANFLSSIDKSIEKINNQIESSKEWKKGLLQKMFV